MRYSLIIIVIFALKIQENEAGPLDWIKILWKKAKEAFGKASNTVKDNVMKAREAYLEYVKKLENRYNRLRNYGEKQWDCGADNVWISKVIAKAISESTCHQIIEETNNACIRHDRCYTEKEMTRTHCDKIFCEELEMLREKLPKIHVCVVPKLFCQVTVYGGDIAWFPQ
ncbi:hypothetical protein RB195_008666 [Necator americanus]|uniref:Uncharacterized protein n=1 Tax=Necator americanus TaxID=51031 RepID=A0ABR1CPS3_NECAM